jgi:hypothetical protein
VRRWQTTWGWTRSHRRGARDNGMLASTQARSFGVCCVARTVPGAWAFRLTILVGVKLAGDGVVVVRVVMARDAMVRIAKDRAMLIDSWARRAS